MTMLDTNEAALVGAYVERHQSTITNALRVYAEHMRQAAEQAMGEYERGQADPEVKAAQDGTLISNNGYRQSAALFTENADKAREVAEGIDELIDGNEDDEDDA